MFDGIPIGLLYLNFIGMVLLFLTVVMGIKLIVRGARGYAGRGGPWGYGGPRGPWGCGGVENAGWRGHGRGHGHGWRGDHPGTHGGHGKGGRRGPDGGRHGGHATARGGRDQALDHADLRLARGEIGTEQYLELRTALTQARSTTGAHGEGTADTPGGQRRRQSGGRALGILRLRLASGEIGVDEFNALRAALDA